MGVQQDGRFLGRVEPAEFQVVRTEGSYLFDSRHRKYIDFVMGWCVGNLGWGAPEVLERLARFRGPDYVFPEYAYKPWIELARLIASVAPGRLTKCFRATGGSEAVDLALQAAMVYTGRETCLSLEGSYHGNTLAVLNRECIGFPSDEKALVKIETRLKRRDVAAFIMEPISINLGVLAPPPRIMTRLQRLCRRYGTLFVIDEVATGFGRTGTLFASEQFDVKPDIMCLGKAITAGAAGMGAMIATPEVAASMEEEGSFYSTYGWHPRSVDAGIATLRYIIRRRTHLLAQVASMSEFFRERLAQIPFKGLEALRIRGLAIGIDVGGERYAARVQSRCRRSGLLITTEGSTLLLLPALTIEREVAARGLDILDGCA